MTAWYNNQRAYAIIILYLASCFEIVTNVYFNNNISAFKKCHKTGKSVLFKTGKEGLRWGENMEPKGIHITAVSSSVYFFLILITKHDWAF